MSKTFKDYLQEAGAPDYNPAAGKYSSNMEYGMFSPEGDAEVEEIVNDACKMVKDGIVNVMDAVDEAMRMLTNLAETSKFEEAEDTDVRDRVAREIMSRCDELGESEMDSTNEAVGDAAAPIYDLIDELGSHQLVMDELIRFLDVDQIEEFVADFRRHHDMKEADVEENAFNQAAAAAARAGKDEFEFGGKTHKTTMKKDTAYKLSDEVDYLKKLAGL